MTFSKLGLRLLAAAALIPSAYFAWQWRAMPQAGIYHDDGIYLVTSKALAEGQGYRIISLPDEPSQTKYPPVYPLLLSLVWRWNPQFPANLGQFALLAWLLLPILVTLLWSFFRRAGFAEWEAALLCVLAAVQPAMVLFSTLVMSELLFTILLTAALLAAERGKPVAAGLFSAAAFLTRSAALPLLVSVPFCLYRRKQRKQAGIFVALMAPAVLGWQGWAALHRAPAHDLATMFYTDYFGYYLADVAKTNFAEMLWSNISSLCSGIADLVAFNQDITFGSLMLARVIAVAVIVGMVRLVRTGRCLQFAVFGLLYAAQFTIWNYPPNYRFVLPLYPLVAAGAWTESRHLGATIAASWRKRKIGDRVATVVIGALAAALVAYAGWCVWFGLAGFLPAVMEVRRQESAAQTAAQEWITRETPSQANILSYSDPMLYLYTGRRGMSLRIPPSLLRSGDRAEIEKFVASLPEVTQRNRIDFVLHAANDYHMDAADLSRPALEKVLSDRSKFILVYDSPGARVYERRR